MLTKSEQKQLSTLLALSDSDEALTLMELEGYLFGLAITPDVIVPSEWLSSVFGGEMPAFDSMKQAETLTGVLMNAYNHFCAENSNDNLFFPFEGKELTADSVGDRFEWAYGFHRAIMLRPGLWAPKEMGHGLTDEQYHDVMMSHAVLIGLNDPDEIPRLFIDMLERLNIDPHDQIQARASLLSQLHHAVAVLQWYGTFKGKEHKESLEHLNNVCSPARSEKIGRNEPCPCGSGKKYKKCCG
jgi:uncharacterized protein